MASAHDSPSARDQIASTYRTKIAQLQSKRARALMQRRRSYGYFVAYIVVLITSFFLAFGSAHLLPQWSILLPVIATVVAFEQARQRDHLASDAGRLLDLYDRRLPRLTHEWIGKGDPGIDLQMADHLSARDLDLFGEGSLFELLCDVQTPAGRDVLAQWLQSPAPMEEVILRQGAIRSLSGRIDLRERVALLSGDEASENSWSSLREWLAGSPVHFPRWAPWAGLVLALSLAGVAMWGWKGAIAPNDAVRAMAIIGGAEGALALFLRRRVRSAMAGMYLPASKLESMRRMCLLVDAQPMEGPLLTRIQCTLRGSSNVVSQLQRLVRMREWRNNELLFWPLLPLLWITQWTIQIERWRQAHGRELLQFLTLLGEFEALMAVAVYAYENPGDAYPELATEGPLFEASAMGHPLMDERVSVQNDLTLNRAARFLLVTGSNMSGKSTLLRAAGLNATLAWMGAPVRATRLRLSPLQVCASIRVDDSLMEGRSHFYAEVARLKAMFDRAASGPPVLFLVDELFAGTNSADRRVAAEAVIRLLVRRGAIGLVTSHDLALTEIPEKPELNGANVHFADLPTADSLSFDYRLRPGKVEHSNALKIIRMMGIAMN